MPTVPSAALALQSAVVARLAASSEVSALTGGVARIFDDVPPATAYPYVTVGQALDRDWSTGSSGGREHTLTVHIWSQSPGRREVHRIAAAVSATLHDAPLALTGHHLVNLRHELTEARRDPDGSTYQGIVRFRAVTEPV